MNSRERRNFLLQELQEAKAVYVRELAQRLEVSDMTILLDLHRLADMNIVTLVHGGAVLNEGTAALANVSARSLRMTKEKNAIAEFCAGLIKEGNAIYLDTGSTNIEIAEELKNRQNIAVLSHSLPIHNILSANDKLQLIAMPGFYRSSPHGFFGDLTCRMIKNFRIDIAFLGICSIDASGIMSPDFDDQAVKLALLERANKKVVVFDHTKINHLSFIQVCNLKDIDMPGTDKQADKKFLTAAEKQGVEIVQV